MANVSRHFEYIQPTRPAVAMLEIVRTTSDMKPVTGHSYSRSDLRNSSHLAQYVSSLGRERRNLVFGVGILRQLPGNSESFVDGQVGVLWQVPACPPGLPGSPAASCAATRAA